MKTRNVFIIALATAGLAACSSVPSLTGTTSTPAHSTTVKSGKTGAATVSTTQDVNVVVNAFVVNAANGQESFTPVTAQTSVKKGDLVEYRALLTNVGKDRIRSMDITLDLPAGATFTGVTEPALGVRASTDGQQFGFMPLRASVKGQVQNIPFNKYQALRWTVEEIGIGATAQLKYRATID